MTQQEPTSMTVDIRPGESLRLHDGLVSVQLLHKSGRAARLRVTAPRNMVIEKRVDESDKRVAPSMQLSPRD